MNNSPSFSLYFASDAYSTANRMMGRQAAGKALIRGVIRKWPNSTLRGVVSTEKATNDMVRQLQQEGFSGQIISSVLPDWRVARDMGTLYYPAPPMKNLAAARNQLSPSAFSFMGVTHTLSSSGVLDVISDLVLPPFQPWDALICTSKAAYDLVNDVHTEMKAYWSDTIGATRFVDVVKPIIPLGINAPEFKRNSGDHQKARGSFCITDDEVVFLFAGRLSFSAKANPAVLYQALEQVAQTTEKTLVCIEAGVFPGEYYRQAYSEAQSTLAPSVRFIYVNGKESMSYRAAWQAADVFVSLSDNIQETFGLTPVEAMAAGLPVVVSDWNGYKDTVRDGIDGFRIPTISAPHGTGKELIARYVLERDSYDRYIGETSLATVVEPQALVQAFKCLVLDSELRLKMGSKGQKHAESFDWPIILERYSELADHLNEVREQHAKLPPLSWPPHSDPFKRFAHFPSESLNGFWPVKAKKDSIFRLHELSSLAMVNFAFNEHGFSQTALLQILQYLHQKGELSVESLLVQTGSANRIGIQALMWLWKFDLIEIDIRKCLR